MNLMFTLVLHKWNAIERVSIHNTERYPDGLIGMNANVIVIIVICRIVGVEWNFIFFFSCGLIFDNICAILHVVSYFMLQLLW